MRPAPTRLNQVTTESVILSRYVPPLSPKSATEVLAGDPRSMTLAHGRSRTDALKTAPCFLPPHPHFTVNPPNWLSLASSFSLPPSRPSRASASAATSGKCGEPRRVPPPSPLHLEATPISLALPLLRSSSSPLLSSPRRQQPGPQRSKQRAQVRERPTGKGEPVVQFGASLSFFVPLLSFGLLAWLFGCLWRARSSRRRRSFGLGGGWS